MTILEHVLVTGLDELQARLVATMMCQLATSEVPAPILGAGALPPDVLERARAGDPARLHVLLAPPDVIAADERAARVRATAEGGRAISFALDDRPASPAAGVAGTVERGTTPPAESPGARRHLPPGDCSNVAMGQHLGTVTAEGPMSAELQAPASGRRYLACIAAPGVSAREGVVHILRADGACAECAPWLRAGLPSERGHYEEFHAIEAVPPRASGARPPVCQRCRTEVGRPPPQPPAPKPPKPPTARERRAAAEQERLARYRRGE